jgi:hypothetical protein
MNNNRELGLLIDTPALAERMMRTLNADFVKGQPIPASVYNVSVGNGLRARPIAFVF